MIQEEIDTNLFYEIVEEFDLYFILESLQQLPNQSNSLKNYPNADTEKVSEWVKRIER